MQVCRAEALDAIQTLIRWIGEDPNREGLKGTPERVLRSYSELFSGYDQRDLIPLFKTFDDRCDEMVVLRGVELTSVCEHHLLPFVGVAHVGYVPRDGKVVGVSKLARLVEVYARRLQLQERLTRQVTDALDQHLKPLGSACVVEARHQCMACRGVRQPGAELVTSSLTGVFREDHRARSEFFQLIRG